MEGIRRPDPRRRDARLRTTVRSQRRFIEMLAHDVRSPIAAAVMRAQSLALHADDETRAALGDMEDMLQDLSRSVGKLVEGMRTLWTAPSLDLQEIDPRAAFRRALESVRRRAERRQIKLEHDLAGAPPTIVVDPERYEALVMWMAAVCIRLTRTNGVVRLTLGTDGESALLRVESSQALAGAHTLAAARRHFLQGRTVEGTDVAVGFGVAVATRLAALHEGRFSAEDDGQPLGRCRLTVLARLPLSLETRPESPSADEIDGADGRAR